jgi:2-polyprenyl-6-methoxyphenol hydroxylase-like FAD-dependent oxidoreductase
MRVLIAGGGISGLVTARALCLRGFDVTVFERLPELRPAGAGIMLAANATAALGELGLVEPIVAVSSPLVSVETRSWRGEPLTYIPSAEIDRRLGAPSVGIHRADLLRVLFDALDPGVVRFGAEITGFDQDRDGVTVHLASGESERGDLLIGADGIHSAVRARLLADGPPRYAGYTAWRGVTTCEAAPPGAAIELLGRGARFGMAPVGGGRTYWWATANEPAGEIDPPVGRKADLEQRFDGWWEPVQALLASTPESEILRNDILDREPVDRWGVGRVTLLGDAAHPMTPNLGQGACQAIEDAVALAAALEGSRDTVAALRAYETSRQPRTARITRLARRMGQVFQWEHPIACRLRDTALRLTPPTLTRRQAEGMLRGG